ncbi:RICIN domain-containing protein [Streptomyces sp. NPDC005479]|uniref:RICIN domain-containing protein n=1 Tax=unclassified Streptomyces TaxID=2593676 RepID=UPI0033BDE2CE
MPTVSLTSAGTQTYRIQWDRPAHGPGCLTVDDASTSPGALLAPRDCTDAANQKYRLEPTVDGYRIRPLHSGSASASSPPAPPAPKPSSRTAPAPTTRPSASPNPETRPLTVSWQWPACLGQALPVLAVSGRPPDGAVQLNTMQGRSPESGTGEVGQPARRHSRGQAVRPCCRAPGGDAITGPPTAGHRTLAHRGAADLTAWALCSGREAEEVHGVRRWSSAQ